MPENILSRKYYDVRFLEIPDDIDHNSRESFIDAQIHSIYPGNNGAYEYIYRIYRENTAVIVFVTKTDLENYPKKRPVIPVFLLPSIKRKPEDLDSLYITAAGSTEKIFFAEGKPVRSQLIDNPSAAKDNKNSGWLFIDESLTDFIKPDTDRVIKTPPIKEIHRYKPIKSSGKLSYKDFYILLLLFMLLLSGISFQYNRIIKQEISEQKRLQNQLLMFSNQKAVIENEIADITEEVAELGTNEIRNPYRLLNALYNTVGPDIRIQRVTIQNDSFSIECISSDPIKVSNILSGETGFTDVSIQRIQENTDGTKLSLSGKYNG